MGCVKEGRITLVVWSVFMGALMMPSSLFAQAPCSCPPPDPGVWIGTAGAGLSLTSGNTDTINYNFSFDITRDPKTRNVMRWTGLYLRGDQDDEAVANRLSLGSAINTRFRTGPMSSGRSTISVIRSN